MDHLWAPWRLSYVATAQPPADDCFLCRVTAQTDDRANLVAHRTPLSVVVLNRFPYNNGHLLVAPRAHKAKLDELTAEELLDGLEAVRYLLRCLDVIIRPEGYNVGLNTCTGTSCRAGRATRTS
jgi:ATP adenylyltransferase